MVAALADSPHAEIACAFEVELDIVEELMAAVEPIDIRLVLRRGEVAARQRRALEEKQAEEERLRREALYKQVRAVIAELEAHPRLGPRLRKLNRTIGKRDPEWGIVCEIIRDWPPEKIQLLAFSGLFSNSISRELAVAGKNKTEAANSRSLCQESDRGNP